MKLEQLRYSNRVLKFWLIIQSTLKVISVRNYDLRIFSVARFQLILKSDFTHSIVCKVQCHINAKIGNWIFFWHLYAKGKQGFDISSNLVLETRMLEHQNANWMPKSSEDSENVGVKH